MNYKLTISDTAIKKIRYWVDKCPKEVSGFGTIVYDPKEHTFYVDDAYLLEQTVGAAHTDITAEGMAKLMYQARNSKGKLGFWWHSHVNMDVFWSSQDTETIMSLGGNGWIVASVFNKREEVRSAVAYSAQSALNDNVPETILYDDITTYIEQPLLDEKFKSELDAQFEKYVKEEKPKFDQFRQYGFKGLTKGKGNDDIDSIATRNIVDATGDYYDYYHNELSERELEELCDEKVGAFGYGFSVEAKVLNLSKKAYRRILKKQNMTQLMNLEDEIIKAEASGRMNEVMKQLELEN